MRDAKAQKQRERTAVCDATVILLDVQHSIRSYLIGHTTVLPPKERGRGVQKRWRGRRRGCGEAGMLHGCNRRFPSHTSAGRPHRVKIHRDLLCGRHKEAMPGILLLPAARQWVDCRGGRVGHLDSIAAAYLQFQAEAANIGNICSQSVSDSGGHSVSRVGERGGGAGEDLPCGFLEGEVLVWRNCRRSPGCLWGLS
jgi:hypothetical protein